MELLLREVRPWPREPGGSPVDVLIRDGRIATGEAPAGVPVAEGRGGVLLPAFADAHAHLDSTRLGLPFRPHTAGPGLAGLISNDRANWRTAGGSVSERATRTLGATIASGATTVRSHVQVDTDCGLERLEGVLAARQAHAGRADVQVVAFPQSGIVRDPGTADLLDAAVRAGADIVGGLDPCAYDRDPVAHLDVVFGIAERHGVGVDIHLHEVGELGAFTFELIAERTAALGMQGRVTISHAFALGTVDAEPSGGPDRAARDERHRPRNRRAGQPRAVAPACASGRWSPRRAGPRRDSRLLVAVRQRRHVGAFLAAGVSQRLPPMTTSSSCASTWRRAADVQSSTARPWSRAAITDDNLTGLAPGARADLVVVAADTVCAAVMDHPPRTLVIRGGEVIARDGELC